MTMKAIMLAAAAGMSLMGSVARAADDPAKLFGAREDVLQISLSPNGKRIAYLQATEGVATKLIVANLDGSAAKSVMASSGNPERLRFCRWSTDTRLVCGVFMASDTQLGKLAVSRLVTLDAEGGEVKLLSVPHGRGSLGLDQGGGAVIDWLTDATGAVLMTRRYIPEFSTGTRSAQTEEGLGVDRVDTTSLKRTSLEPARRDAIDYLADGHGVVRVVATQQRNTNGYLAPTVSYLYRKPADRAWLPLTSIALAAAGAVGFDPQAIDREHDLLYGLDAKDGRRALFSISLDGSLKRELVFARGDVDVDGLIRIGRQQRPVGVSFATDRRQAMYFDPALRKLAESLARALPGLPLVRFVDASADETKLLLFMGSDVDPGRYYLFDKATRHLDELLPARPQLAAIKLAEQHAITFKAADGTIIPAYLTVPAGSDGKNLPAIVLPHGGPGARDEWGFDWLAQYFAYRGFAVLQPNFRGSTGYGDQWFQKNGFQSWRTAIGDVDDAGRYLLSAGIAAPGKMGIVGWSYGGYAALQSTVLAPGLFKAVVAIAPVTDLDALKTEHRDYTDYNLVSSFVGTGEHVRSGSPARNAAAITAPVLLFHGDLDQNVAIAESRLMVARMKAVGKPVELIEFAGLDHYLESGAARQLMLAKADAFLRGSMGL